MSLDYRKGDIDFSGTRDGYENFSQPLEFPRHKFRNLSNCPPATQHQKPLIKKMVLIKPKKETKTWIQEAEKAPINAIFKQLVSQISIKYGHLSNLEPLLFSEEYMSIIGFGPRIVPVLLADLRTGNTPWFWALKAITREDVGSSTGAGNFRDLRAAWLAWGAEKGLI